MAQHKSAVKRHRQSLVRQARNRALRSRMRNAIKRARTAIESNAPDRDAALKDAVAEVNRAAAKNVLKDRTASRYVSRMMRAAAKAQA